MTGKFPTIPESSVKRGLFSRIRLSNWQIILIALLVVGGRLVIDFSQRIIEGQQMLEEQLLLEEEIAYLQQEQKELEAARVYYNSETFIEAWAHNEGKMVQDNEFLVIPIYTQDDSTTPASQPSSSGTSSQDILSPLTVWWSLFFDGSPSFITDLN